MVMKNQIFFENVVLTLTLVSRPRILQYNGRTYSCKWCRILMIMCNNLKKMYKKQSILNIHMSVIFGIQTWGLSVQLKHWGRKHAHASWIFEKWIASLISSDLMNLTIFEEIKLFKTIFKQISSLILLERRDGCFELFEFLSRKRFFPQMAETPILGAFGHPKPDPAHFTNFRK